MSKKRRVGYFKERNENKRMAQEDQQGHNPEFTARREVCTPHRQGENLPHQAAPERGVHTPANVALPTNLPHQATPERGVHTPACFASRGVRSPEIVARKELCILPHLLHTDPTGVCILPHLLHTTRTEVCILPHFKQFKPDGFNVQASSCRATPERGVHTPAFVANRGVHTPAIVARPTNRAVRTPEFVARKNVYILPKKSDGFVALLHEHIQPDGFNVQAYSCRANKDRNFAPHNLQIEEDGFAALLHEDMQPHAFNVQASSCRNLQIEEDGFAAWLHDDMQPDAFSVQASLLREQIQPKALPSYEEKIGELEAKLMNLRVKPVRPSLLWLLSLLSSSVLNFTLPNLYCRH